MGGEEQFNGIPASFWARILETEGWIHRLKLQLRMAAERLRNRPGAAEDGSESDAKSDPGSR